MAPESTSGSHVEVITRRITAQLIEEAKTVLLDHLITNAPLVAKAIADKVFAELIGTNDANPSDLPAARTPAKTPAPRGPSPMTPRPGSATEINRQILKLIPREGATLDEIVKATGAPKVYVRGRLKRLREQGDVVTKGTTKKARYFHA